jgi:hypothetical protein
MRHGVARTPDESVRAAQRAPGVREIGVEAHRLLEVRYRGFGFLAGEQHVAEQVARQGRLRLLAQGLLEDGLGSGQVLVEAQRDRQLPAEPGVAR